MAQANSDLLERLSKLHDELSAMNADDHPTEQIDQQTIKALGQLVDDARTMIDRTTSVTEASPSEEEHGDLMDRVVQFEREHPRVSGFLNQMTDLLAMMGI